MIDSSVIQDQSITFADAAMPAAALLGGIPVLTILVMTAVRYVANGTI